MRWRRTDPVQTVGGVLAVGDDAVTGLIETMARKPALLRALPFAQGPGWAALFAGEAEGEPILPRLAGTTALYEAAAGWWLPVGWVEDVPTHALEPLREAMRRQGGFAQPVIVAPRDEGAADIYMVRDPAPFEAFTAEAAAR